MASNAPGKRKVETPIKGGTNAPTSDNANKKLKKEYKCDLCQATVTSEQCLLEHLTGKKHKAKENALSKSNASASDDADHSQAMTEGTHTESKDLDKRPDGVINMEAEESKVTNEDDDAEESGQEMPVELRDYYKCWCVNCKIGTHTESLMEIHKASKKHWALLLKNGGGLISYKTTPYSAQYNAEELLDDEEDSIRDVADQKGAAAINDDDQKESAGDTDNQHETDVSGSS